MLSWALRGWILCILPQNWGSARGLSPQHQETHQQGEAENNTWMAGWEEVKVRGTETQLLSEFAVFPCAWQLAMGVPPQVHKIYHSYMRQNPFTGNKILLALVIR